MATTYYYGQPNGQVEGPADFKTIQAGIAVGRIDSLDLFLGLTSAGPWRPYGAVAQDETAAEVKAKRKAQMDAQKDYPVIERPVMRESFNKAMAHEFSAAPILRVLGLAVAALALANLGLALFNAADGTIKSSAAVFPALYVAVAGTVSGMLLIGAGEGLDLLRRILRKLED